MSYAEVRRSLPGLSVSAVLLSVLLTAANYAVRRCGRGWGGWSLDLMRYRPDAPRNVMEALLLNLMLRGREEGVRPLQAGDGASPGWSRRRSRRCGRVWATFSSRATSPPRPGD